MSMLMTRMTMIIMLRSLRFIPIEDPRNRLRVMKTRTSIWRLLDNCTIVKETWCRNAKGGTVVLMDDYEVGASMVVSRIQYYEFGSRTPSNQMQYSMEIVEIKCRPAKELELGHHQHNGSHNVKEETLESSQQYHENRMIKGKSDVTDVIKRSKKGLMEYGCSHYRRRCQIKAPYCGEIFDCHHCHNEARVSSISNTFMI